MLLTYFSAHPRAIFLADAIGAFVSTLLLFVIAKLEFVFGMPRQVVYQLLPLTVLFTVYSSCCYVLNPANRQRYVRLIAIANLLYAGLTAVLLFFYRNELTTLGVIYFSAEIGILLLLSRIEWQLAKD